MSGNWQSLREQLQECLDSACAAGGECGCQFTLYHQGHKVIDIAAGFADVKRTIPVTAKSLFPFFSVGKAVLAIIAHQLVEEGRIAYRTPVAELWPEFGVNGKGNILLEHVLSHRAGLYILPKSTHAELADWDLMCGRIAAMTPRNQAGAKTVYHALTYTWLLGHLLELASGKKLPNLIQERIVKPLKLQNELYFGLPESEEKNLVEIDDSADPVKSGWYREMLGDRIIRQSCQPAFAGIGTAGALAVIFANLRGKLLKASTVDYAVSKLFRAPDDPVNADDWAKFGLGFALCGPMDSLNEYFGHSGALGAEGFLCRQRDLAIGFTKNTLLLTHPDHPVRNQISRILGLKKRCW